MSACADLEGLLAERASGPIAADDEARVAEHLASCAACAGVFEEYRKVFGLVALEPQRGPSVAPATLRAFRQRRQRRVTAIALGAGFGAAAAAAALVLAPAFVATRTAHRAPAAVASTWDPDVDAALDPTASSADGTSATLATTTDDGEVTAADVALEAYDDATSG